MENFLLNILPSIAGVVLVLCYLPQIITTIKTKDVKSMNLWFWVILSIAIFMLVINGLAIFIVHGTWGYLLTEVMNFSLAIVMLVLVIKYRKKQY